MPPTPAQTKPSGPFAACPLCGSKNQVLLYPATLDASEPLESGEFTCTNIHFGRHLNIYKCASCGLAYSEQEQQHGDILACYEDVEDETYLQEMQGRIMTFKLHLKDLTQHLPPEGRRHLDVGAYVGVFLKVALEEGWDAHGVEPSRWAREQDPALKGRYLGATVGDLLPQEKEGFDILTMWDVIEHLTDPFETIRQCAEVLKPGGLMALSTHNMASKWARVYGSRYPFLMRMHLFHFSHTNIRKLMEQNGFEVIRIYKHRRFLSGEYFLNRLQSIFPLIAKAIRPAVKLFGLERRYLPMFSFGLMNIIARKKV